MTLDEALRRRSRRSLTLTAEFSGAVAHNSTLLPYGCSARVIHGVCTPISTPTATPRCWPLPGRRVLQGTRATRAGSTTAIDASLDIRVEPASTGSQSRCVAQQRAGTALALTRTAWPSTSVIVSLRLNTASASGCSARSTAAFRSRPDAGWQRTKMVAGACPDNSTWGYLTPPRRALHGRGRRSDHHSLSGQIPKIRRRGTSPSAARRTRGGATGLTRTPKGLE